MRACWIAIAFVFAASGAQPGLRPSISLNGTWQFRLDPGNAGEAQRWNSAAVDFTASIQVPGAWQAQGFGEPSGILRHHYSGPAWYRRTVAIPAEWKDRRIVLRIGGALRRVRLFVNGALAGERDGMSAPFEFDLTGTVRAGENNLLALRVENPGAAPGDAPHAQTGAQPTGLLNYIGNWGGIYGNASLYATAARYVERVSVNTSAAERIARFRVAVNGAASGARIRLSVRGADGSGPFEAAADAGDSDIAVRIPDARLWSPEHPFLYTYAASLVENGREVDRVDGRFGMREIATRGPVLLLNGKPLYLRGYGDDNVEVLNGTPPASKDVYLERLRMAKSFGFNAVRFHSMTPVPEYFDAADEVGILVMAELPAAYTMYFLPHKQFLRNELEAILKVHQNHPSFLSLAFGNEFNLSWLKEEAKRQEFLDTVADFYRFAKSLDPARIILSNDGYVMRPTDMVSLGRGAAGDVPTVKHEFGGYYCSLPDLSLRAKFTGVVTPAWLDAKAAWVDRNGLAEAYPAYLRSSQRLHQLGRKFQIERARRDPAVTGYHSWLIVDYPGGTGEGDSWEEGWLDYFWRPKGISPEEGREINSPVLILIDAGPGDRTLWAEDGKTIAVSVSNYGEEDIRGGVLSWKLTDGGTTIQSAQITGIQAALGQVRDVARITLGDLPRGEARRLELTIELKQGAAAYTNRWSFWSYPKRNLMTSARLPVYSDIKWDGLRRIFPFLRAGRPEPGAKGIFVTSALTPEAEAFLQTGGRVLLLADRAQAGAPADSTFFPPAGGAIGTLIRDHPALHDFPHQALCEEQFFHLLDGGWSIPVNRLPKGAQPLIDSVKTASSWLSKSKDLVRVAYLYESHIGEGRLIGSTLRIRENFDEAYPEAIYLFDRLLRALDE